MSVSVACSCGAKLKAPDAAAGKTVACPKCKTRFNVLSPAADLADALPAKAPAQSQRQDRRQAFPLWVLTTIILAGVLLLCGVVGIGFIAFIHSTDREVPREWPVQLEWEGMTLAAYLAQRPDQPTEITADCRLDNYYNFAYRSSAGTHHSVCLLSLSPVKLAHAWVPKDSEAGKRIYESLKDGGTHRLTLEVVLQGPDGTPTPPGREEMAIVKLVRGDTDKSASKPVNLLPEKPADKSGGRPTQPTVSGTDFVTVELRKLYRAYEDHEATADAQYLKKQVQFTFIPWGIDKDPNGMYCAWANVFGLDDSNTRGRHFNCYFRADQAAALSAFRRGQVLTIRGVCAGKTGMITTYYPGVNGARGFNKSNPAIAFKDCELVGKSADGPASKPPDKPAEKPAEKPAVEEKPLQLADVIRQELERKIKERAGLSAAGLRHSSMLPVAKQIPDPYAEIRSLLEAQKKERLALQGRTVEGTAEFLGAVRNAAGAWIATFQLRLPGNSVRFLAFTAGDAEASLRKLKVGQKVKITGKIAGTSFGGQELLSLFACIFADPE